LNIVIIYYIFNIFKGGQQLLQQRQNQLISDFEAREALREVFLFCSFFKKKNKILFFPFNKETTAGRRYIYFIAG
jgi:hypothetical protein